MKLDKVLKLSFVLAVFFSFSFFIKDNSEGLKIGDKGPKFDLSMKATDGKEYSLNKVKGKNGVLVIFSCNTCPFVIGGKSFEGWQKDYRKITRKAKEANLGVVFVNSNEAKRDDGDSMEDMKKQFNEHKYEAPYLYDEKHILADSFGAKTTPHIYIFNTKDKLIYEGAIDNSWNPKVEKEEAYLMDALDSIIDGKKIKNAKTSPKGCSIKRI